MKILITEETGLAGELVSNLFASDSILSSMTVVFANEDSAMSLVETGTIDVLITEVELQSLSATEFLNRLTRTDNQLKVMFYTHRIDIESVTSLLKAGAQGYICKEAGLTELMKAVVSLISGGAPLSPKVSRILLAEYQRSSLASTLEVLTRREQQVFQCIEEGNSYKGISSKLNISQNTVHSHVKNIYSKLQAVNKYDALLKAKQISAVQVM